ncbi:transposase [Lentzea tibetensis]|uniref:Transposase n=1 Tax=Lentzea tibetensis TaxID=2591470 RepID=A0A563EF34_9PSEU|nr:transposase [Lentzea tibetensis]TWP43571.1 transposase [Lentzea tibetensis]
MTGKRLRVNVMSAVAPRALWFTVFTGRFTAPVFTAFLDRVARQAERKVHVIADRHPVHRSRAVRTWLAANTERVELHLMPGYSPELNPDELLNADLKRTSTPPAPAPPTNSPTKPDASRTAVSISRASSAATSTPGTSATPSCRQPNSFGSITRCPLPGVNLILPARGSPRASDD